ncbi:tandem-95 repeat protein [Novipirellula artificiosorum]|uniref:Dockerin type I repeat protein n=1 Tax=Novipirellula artificiosorum TaxID=2528016 RepID=A0A5C6E3G1_9BACT|nr:tandem-95 repeat protein [Novipirellula artificiosorum]TWU41719.1 Dockerin type I repeat protein [Novipirellula artificiosorum]
MTQRRLSRKPTKASKLTSRRLHHETLEKRELLAADLGVSETAPNLLSIEANSGRQFDLQDSNQLLEAPAQLKFRFDGGQQLDPTTFDAFQFTRSGGDGSFGEANDVSITPGYIGFEDENGTRIVVARFAETLPDDFYTIVIAGCDDTNAGTVGLRNTDGEFFAPAALADGTQPHSQVIRFEVEVGPKVVAVVPQPIEGTGASRTQNRDQIFVYFNEDPLTNPNAGVVTSTGSASDPSVVRPEFYNLFFTGDTVESTDDSKFNPIAIEYDPALHRATLTFEAELQSLQPVADAGGSGTFRLRIGSSQDLPITLAPDSADQTADVGDTFANARSLGVTFGPQDASIAISGEVEATAGNTMRWPGIDSPGVRDDRRDAQITGRADTNDGVNVFYYNFATLYGTDASNLKLENAITPAQQQRTREILDLYAEHLGVQFIETEDRGLQIVTGDLRALVETASTGTGVPYLDYRVNDDDPSKGVLILDASESWFDGYGLSPDARPSWFVEALRGVGSLLGIGNTFDQPGGVASGSNPGFVLPNVNLEPDFLSTSDIIAGQTLHRPEIRDADLYKFQVTQSGHIAVETYAQRLLETSMLDTDLKLWRYDSVSRKYELVARNADFYGDDSFIGLDVEPDVYVLGITAAGNNDYNPNIADSGGGGLSQGRYEIRLSFESTQSSTITDTNLSKLDGDSDGIAGGDFNFWFRVAQEVGPGTDPRVIYVDKAGSNSNSGTFGSPYRTIAHALDKADPNDIVRILPDAGADGRIDTTADNRAYEIGKTSGGVTLSDGATFEIPRGVSVMVDAGTMVKLLNAKISVGSETIDEDRSLASLQVLGTPMLVDGDGATIDGSVDFTSHNEEMRDGIGFAIDTNILPTTPTPGNWGGIEFRNDFDYSEGRPVWETEGIFLDYVSHADIRFGGGSVTATQPIVNPLQMLESRPTLIYNFISESRDAAISADPNSFLETNFNAPIFQQAATFTSDYDRVGPFVRGNVLVDNSINGLFVRVKTPAVGQLEPMTVSGRFDDLDITHVLSQVLVLQGQPGGPQLLQDRPDVLSATVNSANGTASGTLTPASTVDYRVTFVTRDGYESLASEPTRSVVVGTSGTVMLATLPAAPAEYAGRRLYRINASGQYEFVSQLDRATPTFTDNGTTRGGLISDAALATATGERLMPRFDARLKLDPGTVMKIDSARIEATFGADFYAEGTEANPIVLTSRQDDRFGAGGTFDTNNDGAFSDAGAVRPIAGDWSGLVFRQGSSASIDHAVLSHAGGSSNISGGFATFNPVEILQADVRIANSTFSNNANGYDGTDSIRDGVGFNGPSTIFVRGAQPTIVNNKIIDNAGAAISVNPDALNYLAVKDQGRGTSAIDLFVSDGDNQGLLVSGNQLDNNAINGMLIRSEILTTESVWDDTDIVHVVENTVQASPHHYRSGLRLKSDPNQSLVVKMQAGGSLVTSTVRTDIDDAIGGTIQILGQAGFPVILTSIQDCSVGAGFTPDGLPQNDTIESGVCIADVTANPASAGDWYGIVLSADTNDRNVAFVPESERSVASQAAVNAIPGNAQKLGSLAQNEVSADENRRLGFNIRGSLSQNGDIDVYHFTANGGTEVYFDIDDTDFGLDTVVELIDINGNILALSNSSNDESVTPSDLVNNIASGSVLPLFKTGKTVVENPNALDGGMRVILPGNSQSVNEYYVRVRSSNLRPGDSPSRLRDVSLVGAGLSFGQYQLSIRLRETDEIAGSTVRLADIRYATNALDLPAAPLHSPLAGEHAEELTSAGVDVNDGGTAFNGTEGSGQFANADADPVGNLDLSDRGVLRVSGYLGNQIPSTNLNFSQLEEMDLDVYRVDITHGRQEPNIIGENRFVSTVFDLDYADQVGGANTSLAVFDSAGRLILHGRDSNVADDQGRPTLGNDMTNLDGGSAGTLDAYIGPVELQVGTYYVVVSSAQMIPESLNQLFQADPADTNVRILPVDSVRNIAEEGFEDVSLGVNTSTPFTPVQSINSRADLPTITPLFDETSIVPYQLEDVRMFFTLDQGLSGTNQSTLISIDPFTGQLERTIGQFAQPVGDLAMRRDGELFAYSLGPATGQQNNGNTGNFLNISSADASASGGDDGLTFRRANQAGTGTENDDNAQLLINAIAFVPQSGNAGASTGNNPSIPDGERAYVVGTRDNFGRGEIYDDLRRNIVYSVVANSGAATNQGSTNGQLDRDFGSGPYSETMGAASNKQEFGMVDVGQFEDSPPDVDGNLVDAGDITGLAMDPVLGASQMYAVTDGGYVLSFSPFDTRAVDIDPADPGTYFRVINSTNHGAITPHPDDFNSLFGGGVRFASLTLGPRLTGREGTFGNGPYAQVLFGVTENGWIYTMQINETSGRIEPAHVLVNGNYAIPTVDQFGSQLSVRPTGVAFSIREENLWHQTSDLSTPFSVGGSNSTNNLHGTYEPHNETRIRTSSGSSLYFGNEISGNADENTLDGGNGTLNPGGAHGSVVSKPISLEGYSAADKPTMYFTYFLEVEADDDYTLNRQQVDAFRVFAAGDDGQWQMVSTSDSFRSFVNYDEYDYFGSNGQIPVQEAYDNTGVWRQARVDLSPLAGNKNVQLRFDFSTAGGMQSQFVTSGYLTEIQAVAGTDVVDGTTFAMYDSSSFDFTTFEFVRGASVNIPSPSTIFSGQQMAFERPTGATVTIILTSGTATLPNEVEFTPGVTSSALLATRIATTLGTLAPELQASAVQGRLIVPEAESFSLTPERFAAADVLIPDNGAGLANVVALDGQSLSVGNSIGETTTVSFNQTQEVSFGNLTELVTVTSDFTGFADGVRIVFADEINDLFAADVPARATYDFFQRTITVTYNSNPDPLLFPTPTNNDYSAVVAALDALPFFSATLTAGTGTVPFAAPFSAPVFSTNEVFIDPAASADALTQAIADKLNALDPSLQAVAQGTRLVIPAASSVSSTTPAITVTSFNGGTTASQYLPNGNVPVFYANSMVVEEVRDSIRESLTEGIGAIDPVTGVSSASLLTYPDYGTTRIRVFNQQLWFNQSAIGFSTYLPGDEFGAFGSSSISTNQVNTRPGSNNAITGVYIDDIVVGFAERGEVVLNAPANQNFDVLPETRTFTYTDTQQPEYPNEILTGGYTLEVRKGAEYGAANDYDPIRLYTNEQYGLGRSFDTNDRLDEEGVTLIAPSGADLVDGDSFVIGNGLTTLTFEFDSDGSVAAGNVRVPFTPLMVGASFDERYDEANVVASAIRDAINSAQAFNILGLKAAGRDSTEIGTMTDNRIELFGESIQVNPSTGRFLKVDLVAEETFYGRESARTLPMVDHDNQTVSDAIYYDTFARATVTDYVNGMTDTLVAVGKIGDHVGTGDANSVLIDSPSNDVDIVKIFLNAGDIIDVDLDTIGWNLGTEFDDPRVEVYRESGGVISLAAASATQSSAPGESSAGAFINDFTATQTGYYYVRVAPRSSFFFFDGSYGEYQLTVRPGAAITRDVMMVDYHMDNGDQNAFRDQGQLIIESNFIRDFGGTGIRATFRTDIGPDNDANFGYPVPIDRRPGSAARLRNDNTERLLPGTVIANNVIIADGGTGIVFSGEVAASGDSPAPVPFGRIVNNTVVGNGSGVGIDVSQNASPTVLNNIVTDFATGLQIAGNSASTISGSNAYRSNGTHSTAGLDSSDIIIPSNVELFQDSSVDNYIPADGSDVIDSSLSSLTDRSNFYQTVKQPVGVSLSPIIAPSFDAYGIPRVDLSDQGTSGGVGSNVFIDRGAIDRADFLRPKASQVSPLDYIAGQGAVIEGGEIDPEESYLRLSSGTVDYFEIQLFDPNGSGPDPRTITKDNVSLTENGVRLLPDVDYTFGYSANSRLVRLTPLAGAFRTDAVYEITLNNKSRISVDLPNGGKIVDGDQVIVDDLAGNRAVFEFESGYVVSVPQNSTITVLETNARFTDRQTFDIVSPTGEQRRFEINTANSVNSNNVEVRLIGAGTIEQVRDAIWAALNGPDRSNPSITVASYLGLTPAKVGENQLQLGTVDGHSITGVVDGMEFTGSTDSIASGDSFTYRHNSNTVTFTFTTNAVDTSVPANANQIPFHLTDAPFEIAEKIVAAIDRFPQLNLGSAQATGDQVLLGGVEADSLTPGPLTIVGVPGVTGSLELNVPDTANGIALVNSTFVVDVDGFAVTFRYTDDPAATSVTEELILLNASMSTSQIATLTASRIGPSYSGVLTPSASGSVVRLGEQAAIVPSGQTPSAASLAVTANATGIVLETRGVSGGAIPVEFIPTSQFSEAAAGSIFQTAIAASRLEVSSFSPGGGTVWIEDAITADVTIADVADGVLVPAITDLAGNTVQETRPNNETRFTIIMPEVLFDFGDAADSYGTLFASGGPRHTVSGNRTPRLGNFLDTEDDGRPTVNADGDDQPLTLSAVGSTMFDVDAGMNNQLLVTVNSTPPVGGEILQVTVGSTVTRFELIEPTSNPLVGNVPVVINLDDAPSEIASKLLVAMQGRLEETGDALLVGIDPNDNATIDLTAIDDEDGVPIGTYSVGGIGVKVFTTVDADPDNVAADQIMGFLNPLDPAGSNVNIVVTGTGLIDGWIDYDRDGIFQDDEQVFTSVAAIDGTNRLTIPSRIGDSDIVIGDTFDTAMRVRISNAGNLGPDGVAIGGEVEDYIISVLPRNAAVPADDAYTTVEDTPLVIDGTGTQDDLFVNDEGVDAQLIPIRYFIIDSPQHGTLIQTNPNEGYFTYTPDKDFNGQDSFTYRFNAQETGDSVSTLATVTIDVSPVNDSPELEISATDFDLLEDATATTISGFVSKATTGPDTATDELANQILNLTIAPVSIVPTSLMTQSPTLDVDGNLTVFPAADEFGTAIYVLRGTDAAATGNPALVDPITVSRTFTVHVRPVNDPPTVNPDLANTSDEVVPVGPNPIVDEAYEINGVGEITYTLREDNTQALGDTSQPYFIPINAAPAASGYARVGLLDVFLPGPPTEILDLPGGLQTIELVDFPANQTTALGGTLTSVVENGVVVGINYVPPLNYNRDIGGEDSFTYTVRDNGQSWDSDLGDFVEDPKEATNTVYLKLNPVNDRPEFQLNQSTFEVKEDSGLVTRNNFAFNINAGPPQTAFDETSLTSGQQVEFTVTSVGLSPQEAATFFTQFPAISPNGTLTFRPAPNAFGSFEFEVVLSDLGPGNATRGDLISSLPQTIAIDVLPTNDPPTINPNVDPLEFDMFEDASIDIPVTGNGTTSGLLDVFLVGPGNEVSDVVPGGNQTLSLGTPLPVTSAAGGKLTPITDSNGNVTGLRYLPPANYAGNDSFIYTVIDDGVSVEVGTGGQVSNDPRVAANTVALTIMPVNDQPIFSGGGNVTSDEDQNTGLGRGVVEVANWATNVQAGPSGAVDEINGQGSIAPQKPEFIITQIGGDADLFSVAPLATIENSSATLTYVSAPDANGVATFTATLVDDGPADATIGDDAIGETKTFVVTVRSVNDVPTFSPGNDVIVSEDSGPYSAEWATMISPGPADEQLQTLVFNVNMPEGSEALFASLPVINEEGVLRFTPATNAVGTVDLQVSATDVLGATSPSSLLRITITEVNDAPRPVNDTLDPSDEDTVLNIAASELLANDVDPDLITNPNEQLTLVMPSDSFSISGARVSYDAATQTIQYDPTVSSTLQALAPGESLTDSFSYSVRDAAGVTSGPVVVSVEVNGVNDAPILVADNPTLVPGSTTTIAPLVNDTDIDGTIDPTTLRIELQPAFGSVSIDPAGVITYTPFASFSQQDTFSYSVADNLGLRSAPALIVVDANAAPIARGDTGGTFLDEAVVINVAANDSDPDGTLDLTSIRILSGPSRGEAVPLADGTVRYIPATGFVGTDSFTYAISDMQGRESAPATVNLRVVASELQNPKQFSDVNADGAVSALDALLIINLLSELDGTSSIPVEPDDRGPNFYDVNGDRSISASDALQVINVLTARDTIPNTGSGEGEAVGEIASAFSSDVIRMTTTQTVVSIAEPQSAFALAPRPDKLASTNADESNDLMSESSDWLGDEDVIDMIAGTRQSDEGMDPNLAALDDALTSFH